MWVAYLVGAAFFLAFIAIGYFGIQERERGRAGTDPFADAASVDPRSCPLCNAPLRRAATRDEVVFELEHRIDAELRDIALALHSPPESFGRIYRA